MEAEQQIVAADLKVGGEVALGARVDYQQSADGSAEWGTLRSTVALCGIKFFFVQTLRRQWPTFELIRPAKEQKLPVVLRVAEVRARCAANGRGKSRSFVYLGECRVARPPQLMPGWWRVGEDILSYPKGGTGPYTAGAVTA